METINYAKDVRKPIITILAESNFQPYGALGAISVSAIRLIVLENDSISENFITELLSTIANQRSTKSSKNIVDPAKVSRTKNEKTKNLPCISRLKAAAII